MIDDIIYLDTDEEIPAVIQKLKEAKGKKIALAAQKEAGILQSIVNLKLVKNEAEKLKKEIVIISQDETCRNLASQVGIAVYDSPDQQKPAIISPRPIPNLNEEIIEVDMTRKQVGENIIPKGLKVHNYNEVKNIDKKAKKSRKSKFWQIFLFVAVLLVLIYFFVPKAQVTALIRFEPFEKEIEISLPAKTFSATEEKSEKITATGKKNIGTKTKVTLNLFNGWDSSTQVIVAGTQFKTTDGKIFKNGNAVSIPGATVTLSQGQLSANQGKTTLDVEAVDAGEDYNNKSGHFTIASIAPEKQSKIYGEAASPSSGGKNIVVDVASQSDLDNAKLKLEQELVKNATDKINNDGNGLKIAAGSVKTEFLEENATAKADDQVKDFDYKIKLKMDALGFEEKEFQKQIIAKLSEQLPNGKELIIQDNNAVTTNVKSSDFDNKKIVMGGIVKTKIVDAFNENKIKSGLKNQSPAEGKIYLMSQPGILGANIKMTPSWWPGRLPVWDSRIEIKREFQQ